MQGIVVKGLKDYVVATYDRPTWRTIQDRADVDHRLYAPVGQYPDRHGAELAAATRSLTGVDEETVLVRYGGDHCAGLGGITVGLGEHYDEDYAVTERACRREGADRCEIVVRRSPGSAGDEPAASDD